MHFATHGAMLIVAVAALACLCLARASPSEPYSLRLYPQKIHNTKDITSILASIEDRLRVLDAVSATQTKQARRLDAIQDKLDRVETTLTLKLERAQLAAERLEHRLHMLQTNVQISIKESSEKIEQSQLKIVELTQNLTSIINTHRSLLEKVNGAYAETWHRGLVLESLMRDGLSLVNVTRRELADGLKALARRQRDARLTSADLEASFARRLSDNTYKIDLKMQEVVDTQKRFVDSCQRVQQDDPNQVANVLDRLFDSLIDKIATIFRELQTIKATVREHDKTAREFLNTARPPQTDATCRRLESAFRNTSHSVFKDNELKQLTEKFVALTDRADAALQRLEAKIGDEIDIPLPMSDVTLEADKLLRRLEGKDKGSDEDLDYDLDSDIGFFEDGGSDMMDEDKRILSKVSERDRASGESTITRHTHRRHLHKHPYDRGPTWRKPLD